MNESRKIGRFEFDKLLSQHRHDILPVVKVYTTRNHCRNYKTYFGYWHTYSTDLPVVISFYEFVKFLFTSKMKS